MQARMTYSREEFRARYGSHWRLHHSYERPLYFHVGLPGGGGAMIFDPAGYVTLVEMPGPVRGDEAPSHVEGGLHLSGPWTHREDAERAAHGFHADLEADNLSRCSRPSDWYGLYPRTWLGRAVRSLIPGQRAAVAALEARLDLARQVVSGRRRLHIPCIPLALEVEVLEHLEVGTTVYAVDPADHRGSRAVRALRVGRPVLEEPLESVMACPYSKLVLHPVNVAYGLQHPEMVKFRVTRFGLTTTVYSVGGPRDVYLDEEIAHEAAAISRARWIDGAMGTGDPHQSRTAPNPPLRIHRIPPRY